MRFLVSAALTLGLTASAFRFADNFGAPEIRLQSRRQTSNGPVKTLQGNVRIETRNVIVQADKATFNTNTLDIRATGSVHITLKK